MTTETDNFQSKIWFIEYLELWLTTDKSNRLHSWDLQKECVSKTLDIRNFRSKKDPGAITCIKEIEVLKLIAVGSADKEINIWKYEKGTVALTIEFPTGGVHSMAYSTTY